MQDHHLKLIVIIMQAFQPLVSYALSPIHVEPPLLKAYPTSSYDSLDHQSIFSTSACSDPAPPVRPPTSQPEHIPLLTAGKSPLPTLPLPSFRYFDSR